MHNAQLDLLVKSIASNDSIENACSQLRRITIATINHCVHFQQTEPALDAESKSACVIAERIVAEIDRLEAALNSITFRPSKVKTREPITDASIAAWEAELPPEPKYIRAAIITAEGDRAFSYRPIDNSRMTDHKTVHQLAGEELATHARQNNAVEEMAIVLGSFMPGKHDKVIVQLWKKESGFLKIKSPDWNTPEDGSEDDNG